MNLYVQLLSCDLLTEVCDLNRFPLVLFGDFNYPNVDVDVKNFAEFSQKNDRFIPGIYIS